MLRFTGHPLVDVGVAATTAFAGKDRPEELARENLEELIEYIARSYTSGAMTSYLSSVFTMNSVYTQPAKKPEARVEDARAFLLDCVNSDSRLNLTCVFSGEPATRLAFRQHIPMLSGVDVLNFSPNALGGLPISGLYLLALQALPLGSRRCIGRLLAVHCPDDSTLTMDFASAFLTANRKYLLLAEQTGEKYFDAKAPKTLILHTFNEIERSRVLISEPAPSVSVYFLTNDGRDPRTEIYHLPCEVVSFIRKASVGATTCDAWKRLQASSWMREANAKKKGKSEHANNTDAEAPPNPELTRNFLLEDAFSLPADAKRFVRRHLLKYAYRAGDNDFDALDMTVRLDLVSWPLTQLFMREILGMEKSRVNDVRQLADKLAEYIQSRNDRRFFQRLYKCMRYGELRNLFIKASNEQVRSGHPPLLLFDEFVAIFESDAGAEYSDWGLARDLILIRVIEALHAGGWFSSHKDVLQELADEQQDDVELQPV